MMNMYEDNDMRRRTREKLMKQATRLPQWESSPL